MRWIGLVLVLATVVAACGSPAVSPPAGDPATREVAVQTIAYGQGAEQVGDLYLPDGDGPFPVVVLVHGGFWREPYRRDLMAPLAQDLVTRGFAVWNIEYRRVGASGGGYPQTLEDVADAVDHLASLDLPLALDRVATVGHSAGGHLAVWLASRHRLEPGAPGADPRVRPVLAVAQAGVLALEAGARAGIGGGAVTQFLGGDPDEVPDRFRVADPEALVPTGVVVLAVHGDADGIVPLEQSERYVAAASAAGDEARSVVVSGDHFAVITPEDPAWTVVVEELAARLSLTP